MNIENLQIKKADPLKAYNYILLTESGNIKIGRSTDPINRIRTLSNSNSGGFKIIDVCVSPQHNIADTVENWLHWYYHKYQVEGEWFSNLDFNEVKEFFNNLFKRPDFIHANKVREMFETERGMKLSEWKRTHGYGKSSTITSSDDEED